MNNVNMNQNKTIKVQPRGTDTSGSHKERVILEHIFKQQGITDYELTDADGWARYDAIFTKGNRTWIAEMKNRSCKSTAYSEIYLDVSKVHWLIDEAKKRDMKPLFIAVFADNKYMTMDLTNVPATCSKKITETYRSTADDHRMRTASLYLIPIKGLKDLNMPEQP